MHEMSVAQNILGIVQQHLPEHLHSHASVIRLRIGDAAGVVPESLEFCLNAIIANTPLHSVSLSIERVPLQFHCNACQTDSTSESVFFICQNCGANDVTILSGTELQVIEIELRDTVEVTA